MIASMRRTSSEKNGKETISISCGGSTTMNADMIHGFYNG
jgi:hypothetical protein